VIGLFTAKRNHPVTRGGRLWSTLPTCDHLPFVTPKERDLPTCLFRLSPRAFGLTSRRSPRRVVYLVSDTLGLLQMSNHKNRCQLLPVEDFLIQREKSVATFSLRMTPLRIFALPQIWIVISLLPSLGEIMPFIREETFLSH